MLIDKNNLPLVAMDFMNDVHLEDLDIINDLYSLLLELEQNTSKEKEFEAKYEEWIRHTQNHFKGEEVMMLDKKFPPYPVHKNEHEIALKRMDEIFQIWKSTKNTNEIKAYFEKELPSWLINHIQTMDTVTAMFFKTGVSPCHA